MIFLLNYIAFLINRVLKGDNNYSCSDVTSLILDYVKMFRYAFWLLHNLTIKKNERKKCYSLKYIV